MEVLPAAKKDRVDNTFYLLHNKIRFWNGHKLLCEHNRQKNTCKDCGGSSICQHNRQKSQCKECGGSSICQHNREKRTCKECGGSGICQHNRQKSQCKECGGSRVCQHNKQKSTCKECGGSSVCQHNRQKRTCKECGGSSVCQHNKQKSTCKECGGSSICQHNRQKSQCKECGGSSICQHNRQKSQCKDCGGWKFTSETARCNDGCIDILHSDDFISFKYKNKYDCPGVRVCYSCAVDDIRLTEDTALKLKKKEYYNIYTTKVNYLHRIEYAILNYLNEDSVIDELNKSFLNIHDKDIVAILGKSTEMERRPDRAYIINNHLIFFEIDERFFDHEKSIERLKHIRSRLELKFENQSFNLHVVRLNVNADNQETAEKNMVIRKEFPLRDNVDQKDVGYVLSDHGIDIIENDFIPLVQKIQQDCINLKDIQNDEKLMIYEVNAFDLDQMIDWYVKQNEDERNLEYITFI